MRTGTMKPEEDIPLFLVRLVIDCGENIVGDLGFLHLHLVDQQLHQVGHGAGHLGLRAGLVNQEADRNLAFFRN